MRVAVLTLALAGLAPAAASAAPFGEPPFTPVSGEATCLRATGVPGELVRWTSTGARLEEANAAGFSAGAEVRAGGAPASCPAVASQANGAGVLAFAGEDAALRVSLREPAGTWSPPARLEGARPLAPPVVAVSERGDALIAWAEPAGPVEDQFYRVRAARRPAGGSFGAPQTLATIKHAFSPQVLAGVSASGEAIVAWTAVTASAGASLEPIGAAATAIAPPGGPFGTPSRIGGVSVAALAVAPDGRALLALAGGGQVRLAERAPGQAFAAPTRAGDAPDLLGAQPAVALRSGGGAVVAWLTVTTQGVTALTRTTPGAFGAPVVLARPRPAGSDPFASALNQVLRVALGSSAIDTDGGALRAAIAPDGRAVLTWGGLRARSGITSWVAARVATVPLAGGHVDAQALGGPLRDAGSITPIVLASGAPAAAWTDNSPLFGSERGRLRVALEGVMTAADPPAPTLTVGAPRKTRLSVDDSLILPFRCGGPCEVRASVAGPLGASGVTELAHAGRGRLDLEPSLGAPIAPLRRGPVQVTVAYGAPGARTPLTKQVTVTLQRPPSRPVPHVLNLRARRRGNAIDVTWRTDIPAKPDDFLVSGAATRSGLPLALAVSDAEGRSRRFRFRLRPAEGVKFVSVAIATETLRIVRRATAKVR